MKTERVYKDRYMVGFTAEHTILHDRQLNKVIKLDGKAGYDFDQNFATLLNDNDLYMTPIAIIQDVVKSYFDKYFIERSVNNE